MIRPFTCLCVLLAAGSGLYLYSVKHRTLMLDGQIADVLQQADAARARTLVLKTDYAMLIQPDRVSLLAGRYLALRPMAPTQIAHLVDLDRRLPPVQVFPAVGEVDAPAPAAVTADMTTDTEEADPADPPPQATAAAQPLTPQAELPPVAPRHAPLLARRDIAADDAAPRIAATELANQHPADPTHATTRVADAERPSHATRPSAAQYAGGYRPEPMPMAAPRPVASSVLATAAFRPAGSPARLRLSNAEAYVPASYSPHDYVRPAPRYSAPAVNGSMLGSAGMSMAPPVPVAN